MNDILRRVKRCCVPPIFFILLFLWIFREVSCIFVGGFAHSASIHPLVGTLGCGWAFSPAIARAGENATVARLPLIARAFRRSAIPRRCSQCDDRAFCDEMFINSIKLLLLGGNLAIPRRYRAAKRGLWSSRSMEATVALRQACRSVPCCSLASGIFHIHQPSFRTEYIRCSPPSRTCASSLAPLNRSRYLALSGSMPPPFFPSVCLR